MTAASTTQPPWNRSDPHGSLLGWAEWLHCEARRVYDQDGTHAHMLFLFDNDGIASFNPIPPNTTAQQIVAGVRQAVREHSLYGVITIAETWTYFPKDRADHTAFQLLDGEIGVADLRAQDRTEALMVRMESRDGCHVTWMDMIERDGGKARLGRGMALPRAACLKLESYFE